MEKLNIVGKRSGEGFIAHKALLVNALSRGIADRVTLSDLTLGRKGLLGYLKALGGSNVVKVIPSNGGASESQTNGHKRLKVICGASTSYLDDMAWVGEKTPMTYCEVRISPSNTVKPNMGSLELAEALNRVLPFTAKEDDRPVLQCVLFKASEGKLTLVSADGFRLATVSLDCDIEGQAIVNRDDLKGIANALRKASRVSISFEKRVTDLDSHDLVIDTEITRYKLLSSDGNFPDYEKLIPIDGNILAHFDTVEAIKAVSSLKAIADSKSYPVDLTIGDGKIVLAVTDDRGQAELPADTEGDVKIRVNGSYLAEALRACGGMVDLKLIDGKSPMLFSSNGYKLVVMPMLTAKSQKPEAEPEPEAEAEQEPEAEAEAVAVAETDNSDKPKRKPRAREPVTAT